MQASLLWGCLFGTRDAGCRRSPYISDRPLQQHIVTGAPALRFRGLAVPPLRTVTTDRCPRATPWEGVGHPSSLQAKNEKTKANCEEERTFQGHSQSQMKRNGLEGIRGIWAVRAHARVWRMAGMMGASGRHVAHSADQSGLVHMAAGLQKQQERTGPMHKRSLKLLLLLCLPMSHWQGHIIGQVHRLLLPVGGATENLWPFFFVIYHNLKPTYVRNVNDFHIFIKQI